MLIIVSAPSGAGKTTLCHELLRKDHHLRRMVSWTTRPPRQDEISGSDYVFVSSRIFREKLNKGYFLESALVHGYYYGTPLSETNTLLKKGFDVILSIDVQGALSVRRRYPDALLIFILPPSRAVLRSRLNHRRSESIRSRRIRLRNATHEILKICEYDYVLMNDRLSRAVSHLRRILIAERRLRD